ncbi:hypothetical protein [Phenylobacterium immobile]|uniref:hypothetical protein n=1 Tax=Phenylobacterium immobile TaxID=21 RepID=UPI000A47549E|nr:hypothetical protein [Phenylobacterium immobile]
MHDLRLVKVQTPALRLRLFGVTRWFGAHNFVALIDSAGAVKLEMHGIARGRDGAPLAVYGGVIPFRREYIWGEVFAGRSGFYDPSFPQGDLFVGSPSAIETRLAAARAVRSAVNARQIRYPWPALLGANSNAYYATLIAGMGLPDVAVARQLWAPSSGRKLLPKQVLADIARP